MYTGVDRHLGSIQNCACIGAQDTFLVHVTPTTINTHISAHARLCNREATLSPWKLLHTVLNLGNFFSLFGKPKTMMTLKLNRVSNVGHVGLTFKPAAQPGRQPSPVIAVQHPVFVTASLRPSQKLSKSTQAHDKVASSLSHKHHPIIHIGAGPTYLIYGSTSQLEANLTIPSKIYFCPFSRGVSLINMPFLWGKKEMWRQ